MEAADRPWLLRGFVIALALVVALVAWLATRDDGGEAEPAPAAAIEAQIVDAGELRQLAGQSGHPVYWAGPMPGTQLELSESEGNVQVLYVPTGTAAGEGSTEVLTVGSYPLEDPTAALKAFAARPGSVSRSRDGREVVFDAADPTSVYFVSPGNSVQVEVYDPSSRRALGLALSKRVRPAG